ncbi:MAG: hypothetical protein SFU25_03650 [Candidatus Caenarcaniphilales bacterium]|nr:hypothetical protein [Candidatus Caenarcaniphilales bacterium]
MRDWKLIIGVLLVFVAGLVLGGIVGVFGTTFVIKQSFQKIMSGNFQVSESRFFKRFSKELDLTAEQETKIKTILDEQQKESTKIRQKITRELRSLRAKTFVTLKQELNPSQQEKLKQLIKRRKSSGWAGFGKNKIKKTSEY